MQRDMAKLDTGYSEADFVPFKQPDEFFRWVSTNHGSDVAAVCKDRLRQLTSSGTRANALSVLRELVQSTREVDVSRTGIRARFVY
jgi:hypothetical protein